MSFTLQTNVAALPLSSFQSLARSLEHESLWEKLFSTDEDENAYKLTGDEMARIRSKKDIGELAVGEHVLRLIGTRGETVKTFMQRLQAKAKSYGTAMDTPQLLLHRKFHPILWSRPEQVLVSIVGDGKQLKLDCKASAFPSPSYQWLEEETPMANATTNCLVILRCACTARNVFRCRVSNLIEAGEPWSSFYRTASKTFTSELISDVVNVTKYLGDPAHVCDACTQSKMAEIYKLMSNSSAREESGATVKNALAPLYDTMTEQILATDKVALIISNRTYAPQMANLLTPHCDAETLAQALIDLKFKTVTLGDLSLAELKFIVREYRKLLGVGVYAVFYFVGHGFEANGQCYLIPIGAPSENYGPEDCLSMDWVLSMFRDHEPALNLILLDICRKFLPSNLDAFSRYAEKFRKDFKVNRNTVYGYATSGGVGAYEVRGETNGVFMKYLKHRITQPLPVLDMLNKLFRDIEKDKKVRDFQIPELRSNLTKPRSLLDPVDFHGHTTTYNDHLMYWQLLHELPNPVHVQFADLGLQVTIWFDFCGHFTNKVYVFSSVGGCSSGDTTTPDDASRAPSAHDLAHVAYLQFADTLSPTAPKALVDDEEGISLCVLLSNLQRVKSTLCCTVEVRQREAIGEVLAAKRVDFGCVLITRLTETA